MTRRHTLKSILVVLLLAMASTAMAQQTLIPDRWPNLGAGARPLGMGGAFLTMPGSDLNGQFYNPASSDDFKQDWNFDVMDVFGSLTTQAYSVAKDMKDMASQISGAAGSNARVAAFQTFYNKHVGEYTDLDLRIIPLSARTKHFTATVISEANNVISMQNRAFPNFQYRGTGDAGVFATTAWELFEGLQAGVAVKGLYRYSLDTTVTSADILANNKLQNVIGLKQWNKGIGVGGDLGVKYALPIWDSWAPVVAVVYRDIGNTRFTKFHAQSGGKPESIQQSVDAAIGVHPELGDFRLHLEFAASQLNQNMDFLLMTHGGVELEFPRYGILKMRLRAGANQGYPTGGATFDFNYFRLDLLAYGEDTGKYKRVSGVYHYGVEFGFKF